MNRCEPRKKKKSSWKENPPRPASPLRPPALGAGQCRRETCTQMGGGGPRHGGEGPTSPDPPPSPSTTSTPHITYPQVPHATTPAPWLHHTQQPCPLAAPLLPALSPWSLAAALARPALRLVVSLHYALHYAL